MYDSYFEGKIRNRGYEYYKSGKVNNLEVNKNIVTANVIGTNTYNVQVVFDASDNSIIEDATCNCKYYLDDKKYCKHIYATILSVKYDKEPEKIEDIEKLQEEKKIHIKSCQKLLKKMNIRLTFDKKYLSDLDYDRYLSDYNKSVRYLNSLLDKDFEKESFEILYTKIERELVEIKEKIKNNRRKMKIEDNRKNNHGFLLFLDYILSDNKSKNLEDEFGLDEDEIEAMKSGDYTIENFDMENWDEDNYYYEEGEDKPE